MTKLNKVTLNKRLLTTGFAFIILCAGLIGFKHANIKGLEPSVANAATVTYTATANLNVRTGPSTANKIIATVKQGTKLTVTGKDASGWLKVSLNGQTGYVSSQYVKISNSSSGSSTATVTYTATANLNVRTGPSTANKIIATVKQGTKLTVTGKDANGWLKVNLNGQTGYVSSQYVKISNSSSGSSTATVIYTATANLNVRTGPSTANKIIATVKQGTKLTVTGKDPNGWLKVSLNGQTGYVSSQYVKVSNPSSDAIQVVAKPESIPVLVNKKNKLPENYVPKDLVYTSIPFTFKEKTEKRKMRSEAAAAISKLFAESKKQGVSLLGVSAYRSHATQVALFDYYVKRDGYAKAITYSALPGTSEHETGLAIDVTGGNGKCAAQDCFGGTKEAKWLQAHADDYGFIIRYPKGKESVTGYKYEPWHLRYVGKSIAQTIMSQGITLEEYYYTRAVQN